MSERSFDREKRLARIATSVAVLVALFCWAATAANGRDSGVAGNAPSLCSHGSSRATIPASFPLDVCFDGRQLNFRNSITAVVVLRPSGAIGTPVAHHSFDPASAATHLKSRDKWLLAPGDQLTVPVGSAGGSIAIADTSMTAFYEIAGVIERLPVVGTLTAVPSFVQEVLDDTYLNRKCMAEHHVGGSVMCHALFSRNIGFAVGRLGVSGVKLRGAVSALTSLAAVAQFGGALAAGLASVVKGARSVSVAGAAIPPAKPVPPSPLPPSPPAVVPPPACSPSAFQPVGAVSADSAGPGVTEALDPVSYYRVYGDSLSDIRMQLNRCRPPSLDMDGYTSWYLTWYIRWDGSCHVTSASVVLHIGVSLPQWYPTNSTQTGVADRWNAFAAGLAAHEQGHVDIARRYAQKTAADLESLPGGDCGGILSDARSVFSADLAALQIASDAYDSQTSHGASQGASFP